MRRPLEILPGGSIALQERRNAGTLRMPGKATFPNSKSWKAWRGALNSQAQKHNNKTASLDRIPQAPAFRRFAILAGTIGSLTLKVASMAEADAQSVSATLRSMLLQTCRLHRGSPPFCDTPPRRTHAAEVQRGSPLLRRAPRLWIPMGRGRAEPWTARRRDPSSEGVYTRRVANPQHCQTFLPGGAKTDGLASPRVTSKQMEQPA